MTETDEKLDAAQERLKKDADEQPVKRTKDPTYAVYVQTEDGTWDCMSQETKATTRRDAIRRACAANGDPDRSGEFMVIPAKEVQVIPRQVETKPVESWG